MELFTEKTLETARRVIQETIGITEVGLFDPLASLDRIAHRLEQAIVRGRLGGGDPALIDLYSKISHCKSAILSTMRIAPPSLDFMCWYCGTTQLHMDQGHWYCPDCGHRGAQQVIVDGVHDDSGLVVGQQIACREWQVVPFQLYRYTAQCFWPDDGFRIMIDGAPSISWFSSEEKAKEYAEKRLVQI